MRRAAASLPRHITRPLSYGDVIHLGNVRFILALLCLMFISCIGFGVSLDMLPIEPPEAVNKREHLLRIYIEPTQKKTLIFPFVLYRRSGNPFEIGISYQQPEDKTVYRSISVHRFELVSERGDTVDVLGGATLVSPLPPFADGSSYWEHNFDGRFFLRGKMFDVHIELSFFEASGDKHGVVHSFEYELRRTGTIGFIPVVN